MIGLLKGTIGVTDLRVSCEKRKKLDLRLMDLAEMLST